MESSSIYFCSINLFLYTRMQTPHLRTVYKQRKCKNSDNVSVSVKNKCFKININVYAYTNYEK